MVAVVTDDDDFCVYALGSDEIHDFTDTQIRQAHVQNEDVEIFNRQLHQCFAAGIGARVTDVALLQAFFDSVPDNENSLDLELDTLHTILNVMGGETAAPHIAQAIRNVEAEQTRRSAPES